MLSFIDIGTPVGKHENMLCWHWLQEILQPTGKNQEILVPDWLITSHVTQITSSDWLLTQFRIFRYKVQ